MLNGIMVNVSESEHGLIVDSLEAMLANVNIGTGRRLELESLHEELSDHKATFNPETDLASQLIEQIQYLSAIIEKHENTISTQNEMLKVLAIQIRQLGHIAEMEWNKVYDDLAKRYPNIGYADIIKPTFDAFTKMHEACRSRCEQVGMYLYNQKHDS